MRFYAFLICFLFACGCKSQLKLKDGDVFVEEIGWTISFSKNQIFQNTKQIDSLQHITFDKLYKDDGKEFKGVPYKTLFSIVESFNSFNGTIEKYDTDEFKTWNELHLADKAVIVGNLESLKVNSILKDTSSSFEIIDGVRFETFSFQLYVPSRDLTMTTHWYATEKNGYNVVINISYIDEAIGKKYFDILRKSRLKK